jgi:hypothetical protein
MPTRVLNVRNQRYDPAAPDFVYIGAIDPWRHLDVSPWRNIFAPAYHNGKVETPEAIERYWRWLVEERPDLVEDARQLRGKTLYCHCAPPGGVTAGDRPWVCHGQALAWIADTAVEAT